jgi:hypothetical protein
MVMSLPKAGGIPFPRRDHTLVLAFRFLEAIHGDTLTCNFDQDRLRIQFMFSGAVMDKRPDDRADITGAMQV